MQQVRLTLLLGAALALTGTVAQAQLLLSGSLTGAFQPLNPGDRGFGYTTITNTSSFTRFSSGQQYQGGGQTFIRLDNKTFANAGDGDILAFEFISIFNSNTLVNTTASYANLDLYMNFSDPDLAPFLLTTLTFDIDNTANVGGGSVPDLFFVSYTPLNSLMIGSSLVSFNLEFPAGYANFPGVSIPERTGARLGLLSLNVTEFTPVPEPASFAGAGVVMLGLAGLVRRRRRSPALALAA